MGEYLGVPQMCLKLLKVMKIGSTEKEKCACDLPCSVLQLINTTELIKTFLLITKLYFFTSQNLTTN